MLHFGISPAKAGHIPNGRESCSQTLGNYVPKHREYCSQTVGNISIRSLMVRIDCLIVA